MCKDLGGFAQGYGTVKGTNTINCMTLNEIRISLYIVLSPMHAFCGTIDHKSKTQNELKSLLEASSLNTL